MEEGKEGCVLKGGGQLPLLRDLVRPPACNRERG